jgi:hypothetical protein
VPKISGEGSGTAEYTASMTWFPLMNTLRFSQSDAVAVGFWRLKCPALVFSITQDWPGPVPEVSTPIKGEELFWSERNAPTKNDPLTIVGVIE